MAAPKAVQIIARYQIKRNGHVVYLVRSSNGSEQYTTTIINGKASGCTCPAIKPCYHMTGCEAREQERMQAERTEAANKVRSMASFKQTRLARELEQRAQEVQAAHKAGDTVREMTARGLMR